MEKSELDSSFRDDNSPACVCVIECPDASASASDNLVIGSLVGIKIFFGLVRAMGEISRVVRSATPFSLLRPSAI